MKHFLIIGNKNAISYKEIFPLIKNNKLWVGCRPFSGGMWFNITDEKLCKTTKIVDGKIVGNVPSCWFTNLDHKKRHEEITLYKKYNAENYPKYDNYDAIEVGKVTDIPMDYDGVMGVPTTFLGKYNPSQFEIVGQMMTTKITEFNFGYPYINGQKIYNRILIRRKI